MQITRTARKGNHTTKGLAEGELRQAHSADGFALYVDSIEQATGVYQPTGGAKYRYRISMSDAELFKLFEFAQRMGVIPAEFDLPTTPVVATTTPVVANAPQHA